MKCEICGRKSFGMILFEGELISACLECQCNILAQFFKFKLKNIEEYVRFMLSLELRIQNIYKYIGIAK